MMDRAILSVVFQSCVFSASSVTSSQCLHYAIGQIAASDLQQFDTWRLSLSLRCIWRLSSS